MLSLKKPLAFALLMGLGVISFVVGYWNGLGSHLVKGDNEKGHEFVDVLKVGRRQAAVTKSRKIKKKIFLPLKKSLFTFRAMGQPRTSAKHPFSYAELLLKKSFVLEYKQGQILRDPILMLALQNKIDKEDLISSVKENLIVVKDAKREKLVLGEKIPEIKQQYIIIVTTWRSGSTFLGSLLNAYPGTFYSFEPLHYLHNRFHGLNKTTAETKALQILSDVFKCQPEHGYFRHANSPKSRFLFTHNFRFWNICSGLLMSEAACFMPDLTSSLCPRFPIHLIKTVRVRLGQVIQMMKDDKVFKENLKIVVLVRDPRGVMNSRNTMDWCISSPCKDVHSLCEGMVQDYEDVMTMKQREPEKIHLVRYEDLSIDPFGVTDEILSFLKLPKMPQVEKFLETHTGLNRQKTAAKKGQNITFKEIKEAMEEKADAYSTKAVNSRAVPFLWTQTLAEEKMIEVQNVCKKAMDLFGYKRLKNSQDFKVESIDLLTKTREELWPSKSKKL